MIYDCFLFSNELDLLELRLNELNDVVDRFILLESDHTISGLPKPLYYHDNMDRFKQFEDKIEHCIYDYPTDTKNVIIPQCHIENKEAWIRESLSRDLIKDTLTDVKDDDIVIIADADEITSPEAIRSYNTRMGGMTLVQKLFYYRLNCYCPTYIWGWSKIVPGKLYNEMTPQQIRYARMPNLRAPGGWHFSFMGSPEMIATKIKAFAHQEYNRPEITDIEYVRKCMDTPKDIFNRPEIALQNVPVDYSFPKVVQNNIDKYTKMGLLC
jgi:beta-1,4-mannosyl-glycoprotein beta-1,4-N-acetylglucosaminyltransferase